MLSKRFYGAALMGAIVVTSGLEGCSSDNPLCCSEFKVGAQIDANIGGSAQSQVAVQAVADFAGIASAAIDDLTTACRSISQDLVGDPTTTIAQTDIDAAEAQTDKTAKMNAHCQIAVKALGEFKAKITATGSISIQATPPVCQASISAKANCQAKCSGSASCDLKANPPTCSGGPDKLEISCKADCKAKAGASLNCEGSCDAHCSGSCQGDATLGIECSGKCDGTCTAGGTANGSGAQADGTCKGICKGTCAITPPTVTCNGSCSGGCTGTCHAKAGASITCNGDCSTPDFTPIKCDGGDIQGGCKADVKCDGNCDASVSAKAECTPPAVEIVITGGVDATVAGKFISTLKANFGVIVAFKSRLEAMGKLTATFTGNIGAVTDIKAACIPLVFGSVKDAAAQVGASASVAANLTTSVGPS